MTEPTQQRTYRTRSGRLLTEADIERIAEEVAMTDIDITKAKIRVRPGRPQPARNPDTKSPLAP